VQGFPPPGVPPERFTPYGVGYVELAGCLRVESRLVCDPGALSIGMGMELVRFGEDCYAFAPV
jgi:uncharacterized OB-fold protein